MKERTREHSIHDMLCSRCHKPFDVSVTQTPDGRFETYAQCFSCLYSIKLHRFEPDRKKVTIP